MARRQAFGVRALLRGLALAWVTQAGAFSAAFAQPPASFSYEIVRTYPHDPAAFTQGLAFDEGVLYEGTGLHGQSSLRVVELGTGDVVAMNSLHPRLFGEGVTVLGDKIIQLTWKSRLGLVYDKNSLDLQRTFRYPTEGWGLTHDGERLILSDGTATLYFLNPGNYTEVGRIEVRDENGPVTQLNELEYVKGEILANVWKSTRIARISPKTGRVTGWIELAGLSGLVKANEQAVLNGIAYDAQGDRLFVTGKFWPTLFEIRLAPSH
jgi:glutamine cyclotransferase